MEQRRLGSSGLQVSAVGLGCNNFGRRNDAEETRAIVARALDLGVTFFDTANTYGERGLSEEYLGKALGARRPHVVVATKFGMQMGDGPHDAGGSRKHVVAACEASLQRLGSDYIDLYQIHRPDPQTPIDETLSALDDLVRAGKVRYTGCSNFNGWQLVEAAWVSRSRSLTAFVSAQNYYNLLDRRIERELVPACERYGASVLPFFPLASGFLTGKYRKGQADPEGARLSAGDAMTRAVFSERNWTILEQLERIALDAGRSLVELAIGWLASQPHVASVISGATRPEQVEQNVSAGEWRLTREELERVDAVATRR